jgi:hypothetical protein
METDRSYSVSLMEYRDYFKYLNSSANHKPNLTLPFHPNNIENTVYVLCYRVEYQNKI